ncbi:MAG TPA: beta-L-arabinofuranosidase domain-containing protein [Vicinamibacteria bacterium]|nr:beta-L-arabinofuranosidase domain-containing protein [Vicinamibacteria bacterium]
MSTRREFTTRLLGGGAALALAARARSQGVAAAATTASGATVTPRGELAERIRLTAERLTRGGRPAYTRDFVLADVALDRRRRFWEFSGDLSGRYLEALSSLPPAGGPDLRALASDILSYQRTDGRFGDATLRYAAAEIAPPHMALLWGNGRLLVGLLRYHASAGDARSLQAARRLADFLVGVREQASDPAVARRLVGQGAFGIICFTQLVEPLVGLFRVTGDGRYLEAARAIAPSLGPRGIQHAHGYLTTLRGLLDLAGTTKQTADLARVERLYAELVASPDLCWMGGVLEYFGWEDASVTTAERQALLDASGNEPRDEGCGIADFLRLSLGLHRATGKPEYLDRAERCLLNHLCFNQFTTGDFGSRTFFRGGTKPTENVDRAWWCCTMHGYRAFADVLEAVVHTADGVARVDLFLDADWKGDGLDLALRHAADSAFASRLRVDVRAASGAELAFRRPSWAREVRVRVNGVEVSPSEQAGALQLPRPPRAGDQVEVLFDHALKLEARDHHLLVPGELREASEALLFLGPWLYAVDDGNEPLFFGEPWLAGNVVEVPGRAPWQGPADPAGDGLLVHPERHVVTRYQHAGFAGTHTVRLRPVAEQAAREPGIVAAWLRYRRDLSRS